MRMGGREGGRQRGGAGSKLRARRLVLYAVRRHALLDKDIAQSSARRVTRV
jgi:hypothetical protein